MASERAPVFDEHELDLSDFKAELDPQRRPDLAALRSLAAERGFVSREVAKPTEEGAEEGETRLRRRYTTGRNRQLNLRVTSSALNRFYALADENGWVLGETFEHAVIALERSLKVKG